VLYVNPGSAGPRRFKLPIAVGELRIDGDQVSARTVDLEAPTA
jgi:predicted phosphodiesterase